MLCVAFFVINIYIILGSNVADATIGMNWGRQNAQRLLPSNVVDLILQNGIKQVRIFSTEEDMLRAFAGTGIELTINIPNTSAIVDPGMAKNWVQHRKQYFDTNISNVRQIYISDNAFALGMNDKAIISSAMQALKSLQTAINDDGFGDQIKVTIPHPTAVLSMNYSSLKPSDAEFHDEIKQEMAALLDVLQKNNAPFVINTNPITDLRNLNISDLSFAIPNASSFYVKDENGTTYTSSFALVYDALVWSMIKLNPSYANTRIVVGQVGWPTDGYPGATASMAERFYKGFLPWVARNTGTPMRPGKPIDIYIHSLTDESKIPVDPTAAIQRHFGIYMSNGKPKYKVDMSGGGRDIYPIVAKGIMRMPNRWCVFNEDFKANMSELKPNMDMVCNVADCTATLPGGSCSNLTFAENATYIFNMYFQLQFQNETQCDFGGLAKVSTDNPSTHECVFPVEVVKANLLKYRWTPKGLFLSGGVDEGPNCAVFVIVFSVLEALFWN